MMMQSTSRCPFASEGLSTFSATRMLMPFRTWCLSVDDDVDIVGFAHCKQPAHPEVVAEDVDQCVIDGSLQFTDADRWAR